MHAWLLLGLYIKNTDFCNIYKLIRCTLKKMILYTYHKISDQCHSNLSWIHLRERARLLLRFKQGNSIHIVGKNTRKNWSEYTAQLKHGQKVWCYKNKPIFFLLHYFFEKYNSSRKNSTKKLEWTYFLTKIIVHHLMYLTNGLCISYVRYLSQKWIFFIQNNFYPYF